MTGHFEAKKHAYRQTQDGIVVSFVIHPNDLNAEFAVAALGTRYMVAFAEIGDDESRAKADDEAHAVGYDRAKGNPEAPNGVESVSRGAGARSTAATSEFMDATGGESAAPKDRRPFASLPLSQQAAIRCSDASFEAFLKERHHLSAINTAASRVRLLCDVVSRSELDFEQNETSRTLWNKLEDEYQAWLTTQRYAHVMRK